MPLLSALNLFLSRILPIQFLRRGATTQGGQIRILFDMAIRSVTVGIFDSARDAERAVEDLVAAGFEDTVYEDAAQKQGRIVRVGPTPVDALSAPDAGVSDNMEIQRAKSCKVLKVPSYRISVEGYTTTFEHGGKFIRVRAHPKRLELTGKSV
jgi:hypothetical protein